jgi:hypothetical protein
MFKEDKTLAQIYMVNLQFISQKLLKGSAKKRTLAYFLSTKKCHPSKNSMFF